MNSLPNISKVCSTIAEDLISVQPLSGPSGVVFHMSYSYTNEPPPEPEPSIQDLIDALERSGL